MQRGSRWRRLPIWARLLALGLVPLVGIGAVALPTVLDRGRIASAASETARRVNELRALYGVQSALMSEIPPTEAELRAASFGLTVESASTILGFDLAARLTKSRAELDRQLEEYAPLDPTTAAKVRGHIEAMRQGFDTARSLDAVHAADTSALDLLVVASNAVIDELLDGGSKRSGSTDVASATRTMTDVLRLYQAFVDEIAALFRVTVSGAAASPTHARYELAGNLTLFKTTLTTLRSQHSATITAALDKLLAQRDVQQLQAAVDDQLSDAAPGAPPSAATLANVFRAGFSTPQWFNDLVHTAADEALGRATDARNDAEAALRNAIIVLVLSMAAATLLGLLIARSITNRLARLAKRALQVSEGSLDGPDADETGPRETAVVAHAMNESVANLRRLQDQAAALARGELDAAVLEQPGIGEIGGSIHATVQRLADAWRESEELKMRLAHQANHDLLTALPNRKAALETLGAALARAARYNETVAVLFVDLDDFKRINDTYGHHTGDRVLRLCAQRLSVSIRHGDIAARLGGDEFVVITERIGSIRDAVDLAERLVEALSAPFSIDRATTHIGASVGIGLSVGDRPDALELLRDADNAVHRAKRLGKGRVEIFDERARDELTADSALEHALRLALDAGDLELHYQPISDTETGDIRGFEALARWTLDGDPVPAARFITVAEHSDLINEIGRWALLTATQQLGAWTDDHTCPDGYVAVNISGRHLLHHEFLEDVRSALHASGLDPRRLTIELTETVVLADLPTAAKVLSELRALGVVIALDDFGTGYTSIAHLGQLPIDAIKIDGSFIRHLDTRHDQALVELMIEIAHTLDLGLVGECVETQTQLDLLRDLGCDQIQGYLIGRPEPAPALVHRLVEARGAQLTPPAVELA